jgi:hypothetical protein
MSEIVKITDWDARIIALIIEQYKEKTLIEGIPTIANIQAQDLENALFEIRDNYWLDTAEGKQLDVIGKIMNILREGRNDTEYRMFLKSQAGATFSGTPEEIINILKASFGYSVVEYTPGYPEEPAFFYINTEGQPYVAQDVLYQLSPAGVGGLLLSGLADAQDNQIQDGQGRDIGVVYQLLEGEITDESGDTIDDDTDTPIESEILV